MAAQPLSGIYEIVNLVNGKRYVGSATNLKARWSRHRHDFARATHRNRFLQNAWEKYGREAFEFRVIELCAPADLIAREQFHIDAGCDYNICRVAGSLLGKKLTAEHRARISASQIGKKVSPEAVERSAAAHRGLKRPIEAVERTAAANRGRKQTPETIAKYREAWVRRKAAAQT